MSASGIHIVLNPTSGGGRAQRRGAELVAALAGRGVQAVLHATQAPGHGVELAHMLATAGARAVVAAGGDGTIHDVANGILRAGTNTALAVVPLGTGNDFAKVVPGAGSLAGALDILAQPRVLRFDAGFATWPGGDEFFINGMGTGIDVEVVRQIRKLPALPGAVKYLLGLFRALAVYRPVSLAADLGNERIERSIMMMAVGNGVCQGGGFYLTPAAKPDDGRLELCVIAEVPLRVVARVLPRVLRGTHAGHDAVTMRSFERVRFEARGPDPLYFQLDGELREPPQATWLDVEVRKSAINVWAGMDTRK